ncbi:MAG: hypothetical protein AAFO15_01145 [Pseudomonadota bacterium]
MEIEEKNPEQLEATNSQEDNLDNLSQYSDYYEIPAETQTGGLFGKHTIHNTHNDIIEKIIPHIQTNTEFAIQQETSAFLNKVEYTQRTVIIQGKKYTARTQQKYDLNNEHTATDIIVIEYANKDVANLTHKLILYKGRKQVNQDNIRVIHYKECSHHYTQADEMYEKCLHPINVSNTALLEKRAKKKYK